MGGVAVLTSDVAIASVSSFCSSDVGAVVSGIVHSGSLGSVILGKVNSILVMSQAPTKKRVRPTSHFFDFFGCPEMMVLDEDEADTGGDFLGLSGAMGFCLGAAMGCGKPL